MKSELTKIKKIKAMLNEKDLDNESLEYGVFSILANKEYIRMNEKILKSIFKVMLFLCLLFMNSICIHSIFFT